MQSRTCVLTGVAAGVLVAMLLLGSSRGPSADVVVLRLEEPTEAPLVTEANGKSDNHPTEPPPTEGDDTAGQTPAGGDTSGYVTSLEGVGRSVPVLAGACSCWHPTPSTEGSWESDAWVPSVKTEELDGPFLSALSAIQRVRHARQSTDDRKVRVLLVGDSIARYMMCFLAHSVARELAVEGLVGCEPEQSRGAHFQLWPQAPWRDKSPVLLHFVSDFYFPESHVAQDLGLMEMEEAAWMAPADVVLVSRGTWDTWIRMPRATAGRHLFYGHSAGLLYLRELYPHAEVVVYGVSYQYPARYHKHSERCAMQTSLPQVRSLVYCSARRVNARILEMNANRTQKLKAVRYFDFYAMTRGDHHWAVNTMNSDGMHYIGPHAPWFAKYVWRLVGLLFDTAGVPGTQAQVERSTPRPIDTAQCAGEDHLAMNTMPRQKKLKNPAKAKGAKVKRDCGLWLADRQMLLDFHKSFHRLHWRNITRAIQYSDCVFYHKASAQRLGGVDLHWPSAFTEAKTRSVGNEHPFGRLVAAVLPLRTALWDRWRWNSSFCHRVERTMDADDVSEMNRHIDSGIVPCGHRLLLTLRSPQDVRNRLRLPPLLEQHCDMVRKNRDL